MKKIIVIVVVLFFQHYGFAQHKPDIYFSGIADSVIKVSQLSDKSIKLFSNNALLKDGQSVNLYFTGTGYPSTVVATVTVGMNLSSLKQTLNAGLNVGTKITIEPMVVKNIKENKEVYLQGCTYKIIAD